MKPIDMLTKYLDPSDDMDIGITEPYTVFEGLTVKEMEQLHDDIEMYLDLDRDTPATYSTGRLFWWFVIGS